MTKRILLRVFGPTSVTLIVAGVAWAAPIFAPPYSGVVPSDQLIKQPVTTIFPGVTPVNPDIKNPFAGDPDAAERGLRDFERFNCVGCHAPNGGGGMGPSLSNDKWIYGADPAQIYLTILQGRPNGMPAWGSMLPDTVIWELVSYIKSIAHAQDTFGKTTSRIPQSPALEQVPADKETTTKPWSYTEPFENGQKPPG
jgi:cytochrome c oxidase cbb3-type subunit 3